MMSISVGTLVASIVGGVLTLAGGLLAIWLKLRSVRRTRMNEIIAEHKVRVDAEAYVFLMEIEASLARKTPGDTLSLIARHDDWFAANRLFLPGAFPEKWAALRTTLQWSVDDPLTQRGDPERVHELKVRALALIREAMHEVRADMELRNGEPLTVER
jgi:hypothetical protein